MDFLGLTDSTQLAGLEPSPQGVAHLTNGEIWGRRSNEMTDGTKGGGKTDFPTNGR